MLYKLNLSKILFLDIETVSQYPSYNDLDERAKELWDKKARYIKSSEEDTAESLYSRAAIYAEFGKIIVVSVGFFNGNEFRIKSFYGDDEKILLEELVQLLQRFYNLQDDILCAHNGKEFDFPYLSRRMLINGISLPYILQIAGKKPWEIRHIDTMELWKFGDFKSYTSLDLLTYIFDIPTPKDDIDGSMVGKIYWEENDLERIKNYCQKDVLAIAQLLLRYINEPLIKEENIVITP